MFEMDLSDVDLKILGVLLGDARLSSRQIGRLVGVSVGTVISRG